MFKILAFAVALCLTVPFSASAQTNQRTAFNQGIERFNNLVMEQRLSDALKMMRPEMEMSDDDIVRIDNRFWEHYPKTFVGHDTVRSEALKSGFRQEVLAYWDEDNRYFFVYLLIHATNSGFNVVNIDYSTDFESLNANF
ncbi:hypothetical protein [Shimia haliotis]|uniref:DUF3887 domain-containing protein n=1 Tax=Shimia haliotis TaxID=1280847 RepID=A0A1I4B192_9RHOB|nr:hypothetical protein [Shimia haliotis]SFK61927.1 hypothetical protein SAMN04488036_101704 [Shimia haliotis]